MQSLDSLRTDALTCRNCSLCETRTNVVFGSGNPSADLMFVGEAPGAQEDLTGQPFVGRSGRLLTSLIEGIGLTRDQVYISNVVKCRPPANRDPDPSEVEACAPIITSQIENISPRVLVTLGNFATKLLLETKTGITKLRGSPVAYRGGVLIPVLHPAAVARRGAAGLIEARSDFEAIRVALLGNSLGVKQ